MARRHAGTLESADGMALCITDNRGCMGDLAPTTLDDRLSTCANFAASICDTLHALLDNYWGSVHPFGRVHPACHTHSPNVECGVKLGNIHRISRAKRLVQRQPATVCLINYLHHNFGARQVRAKRKFSTFLTKPAPNSFAKTVQKCGKANISFAFLPIIND